MAKSFWEGRKVLVTGGTGLLGGWLIKELLNRGADVIALVRDRQLQCMFFAEGLDQRVTSVQGTIEDGDAMRRILAEYEIQTVFHLAAQTLVGVAKKDPVGTLKANITGTWTILEAARQVGGVQVLLASSDKAYGISNSLPYRESDPLRGEYPYDASKSCADLIGRMYAVTYDVPVAITRCGNLFGGGDLNFSRSIPGLIKATLENEAFQIRSDGKFVRDFLYVEDAADGYLQLAEKLAADPTLHGEGFNFSLEQPQTVLDIVDRVLTQMNRKDLEPVILNQASNEIREQYLSAEYAAERLGWRPKIGLDEGLRRTIEWYRRYLGSREAS